MLASHIKRTSLRAMCNIVAFLAKPQLLTPREGAVSITKLKQSLTRSSGLNKTASIHGAGYDYVQESGLGSAFGLGRDEFANSHTMADQSTPQEDHPRLMCLDIGRSYIGVGFSHTGQHWKAAFPHTVIPLYREIPGKTLRVPRARVIRGKVTTRYEHVPLRVRCSIDVLAKKIEELVETQHVAMTIIGLPISTALESFMTMHPQAEIAALDALQHPTAQQSLHDNGANALTVLRDNQIPDKLKFTEIGVPQYILRLAKALDARGVLRAAHYDTLSQRIRRIRRLKRQLNPAERREVTRLQRMEEVTSRSHAPQHPDMYDGDDDINLDDEYRHSDDVDDDTDADARSQDNFDSEPFRSAHYSTFSPEKLAAIDLEDPEEVQATLTTDPRAQKVAKFLPSYVLWDEAWSSERAAKQLEREASEDGLDDKWSQGELRKKGIDAYAAAEILQSALSDVESSLITIQLNKEKK